MIVPTQFRPCDELSALPERYGFNAAVVGSEETERAAALIKDVKQQRLLDSTIVIWVGEFGRTPMNEARKTPSFRDATIIGGRLL